MKKIMAFLTAMLIAITVFAATNKNQWSGTFIVTSGEEISLGLTKGAYVQITEENCTTIGGNTYYIKVSPIFEDIYLTEHAGGMASMTSSTFKYNGKTINVSKNDQRNPSWMRIGGCELRAQR